MVGADGWRRRLAGTSQSGPDPWRGNTWLRHLDQEHLVVVRQETHLCQPQPVREPGPFGNLSTLQQLESWRKLDPGFKSSQWSLADKHFEKYVWSNNCLGRTAKNSQTAHKKLWTIVTTFVAREERSETLLSEKKGAQPQKNASVTVRLKMCRERGFRREIEGFETKILGLEKIVSCHSG